MKKVLVVGGGCAGLSAAHTLNNAGYEVKVIEAMQRAGGRMTSFKRDGFCIDEGAQMVHPGYRVAREIMKEVGVLDQLVQANLGGIKVWFNDAWVDPFPPPGNAAELAKTDAWMNQMGKENFGRFAGWVAEHCKDKMYEGSVDWMLDVDAMKESFGEYVESNFGKEVLACFAQPVLAAIGLEYPEKVGIGFGLQIMWTVLCGEAAVLKYGLGNLAEIIINNLGKDKVITGMPVKRIVIENSQVKGVETNVAFYEADAVVCSVPAVTALKIIPELPKSIKDAISTVTYCPTMHVSIFVDKEMSDGTVIGGLLPRYSGSPFCTVLFQSARSKAMMPPGKDSISVFFYGDGCAKYWDASDEEVTRVTVKKLQEVFPQMPKTILFSHVARYAQANFTMHNGAATAIKNFRDNHYQDAKGLYFCGEYMYTGSYESAMASGRRAAKVIMGEQKTI